MGHQNQPATTESTPSAQLPISTKLAQELLNTIETLLRKGGALLMKEFKRPEGPRGSGGHADVDGEVEAMIRDHLDKTFPDHGVCGEELGHRDRAPRSDTPFLWQLDPNDGTKSYLKGFRGSSVSVGLLYDNEPIAGGVFAFNYPNDGGDLIMGGLPEYFGGLTRNGEPCARPAPVTDPKQSFIAVSQDADRCSAVNMELVSPSRFIAIPSIAYRLALAAVDDVQVGVSLAGPVDWDCAGGHALLRAQGRELYTAQGHPYIYGKHGSHRVFGGDQQLSQTLAKRDWERVFRAPSEHLSTPYQLCTPSIKSRDLSQDSGVLKRAQGCLLGLMTGDALGSLVEFKAPKQIERLYPQGVREMEDGGVFNTLAGQVTDDSEMALALARSILHEGGYSHERAAEAYATWIDSDPFDRGITTTTALAPALRALRAEQRGESLETPLEAALSHASRDSQANGALMRVAPLAIFGVHSHCSEADLVQFARLDARITHPHQVCQDANAVYTVAIRHALLTGESPESVYQHTLSWAQQSQIEQSVLDRLIQAKDHPPTEGKGWVLIGLHAAFYALLHHTFSDGVSWAISLGSDTDTNAAITGALLGAVHGLTAIPNSWTRSTLSNRPSKTQSHVYNPRPRWLWTSDAMNLAEALLSCGEG